MWDRPEDGPLLTGERLAERLVALSGVLEAARPLWATRPFRCRRLPWEEDHPALSRWLRALPPERLFPLEGDPFAAEAPEPWPTWARAVRPLLQTGRLPAGAPLEVRHPLALRVRGRKWEQVRGFLAVVEAVDALPPGPVIEWCAGRGNLGRTLATRLGRAGLLLERDPELCHPPGDVPETEGVRHVCVDVLSPEALAALEPHSTCVALHACGSLTDRVIEVAAKRADAIIVAPCCMHRLQHTDVYQPLSALGRTHDLRLEHDDLRVATREACQAGARRARLRARELLLRSAWDLALREHTGHDVHHRLPVMPRAVFDLPLATFLEQMAGQEGVTLPPLDIERLERQARLRVEEVRMLELPRLLFRRAMELWVDLDRAEHLREAGWEVSLGTFCHAIASPRNLAIRGLRRP